jgi:hypothetical protein
MATIKYFSGTTELTNIGYVRNEQFAKLFPGVKGIRSDSFDKIVGYPVGTRWNKDGIGSLPVTRKIEFKSNPSLHKCDARCQSAKGGSCECSCGGKFHGAGFSCEQVAA